MISKNTSEKYLYLHQRSGVCSEHEIYMCCRQEGDIDVAGSVILNIIYIWIYIRVCVCVLTVYMETAVWFVERIWSTEKFV